MTLRDRIGGRDEDLVQVLGYLNFSSGKPDPKTLQAINRLFGWAIAGSPIPGSPYAGMPPWLTIQQWLQDRLVKLSEEQSAFRENSQASQVLQLVWLELLPAYIDFHCDLLFHQEPEGLFNGLFLGRAIEAVLEQGPPWDDKQRVVTGAIRRLNDFVGYRPVAVLEGRRLEPYAHEWLRPIPLYIEGVGVAHGPYYEVVRQALEILRGTNSELLHACYFDFDQLEELALDPRAYDFDHPVNKRPNYHFGLWDPHQISLKGRYTRFIVQQVTLDALLARVDEETGLPKEELIREAATVLAGTMLMAAGVCGFGPDTFDSTISLASLMTPVAQNRDRFYDDVLASMSGTHAERLQVEQRIRRQSFGGARQHLNARLARQRADQLARVHLARLFARMGSASAAKEESDQVLVPSARIRCRIDCLMTTGNQLLLNGQVAAASRITRQIRDYLIRGIECGAQVDPWNILGFAGNFPRFTGPDATVHDQRVNDLIQLMEDLFSYQSRLWRAAASLNDQETIQFVERETRELTDWWRQYAAHTIADLQATDPAETLESAQLVARALKLWYQGGASTGDLRFWASHADLFDSPKAYALVIEALIERQDFVASMALLVHWLSQANRVGLQSGQTSFSDLARLWLETLNQESSLVEREDSNASEKWNHIEKFFDYLEANGEEYWMPPTFRLFSSSRNPAGNPELLNDGIALDEDDGIFDAAYEDVVYRDSTDDGRDSPIFEDESETEDELSEESRRLNEHLTFLSAVAEMWKSVALSRELFLHEPETEMAKRQLEAVQHWCDVGSRLRLGLTELIRQVYEFRIAKGASDTESMSQYDRKRVLKEALLERVIGATIEISDALRLLLAVGISRQGPNAEPPKQITLLPDEDQQAVRLFAYLMAGRRCDVEDEFGQFLTMIRTQRLLYVPLVRGGDPSQILAVRLRRRVLGHLLSWLPRQGLIFQSIELIETARYMESHHPVGPGAVTEFDELFQLGFKSIVRCLVRNALAWHARRNAAHSPNAVLALKPSVELDRLSELTGIEPPHAELIPLLETLTEVLLNCWLAHSRTLRLSVLETVDHGSQWDELVSFIEKFGSKIFTQSFLKLTNVRAILHQGIPNWLERAREDGYHEELQPILDAIDQGELAAKDAHRWLDIVLEAIIDHFSEYRDYNSTTTQSDRGEMLYMFLDFLRLRVRYDRVNWNLRPVSWAHEILVRCGCPMTANAWRRALSERISKEADHYQKQLADLQERYAMRMPTIADRLAERFIRPMTIDRMRALVRPAMKQLSQTIDNKNCPAFNLLVQEAHVMMREPSGIGFEAPPWLQALEEEVDRVLDARQGASIRRRYDQTAPMIFLSRQELENQLQAASRRTRNLN